jgi:hypothetical protein
LNRFGLRRHIQLQYETTRGGDELAGGEPQAALTYIAGQRPDTDGPTLIALSREPDRDAGLHPYMFPPLGTHLCFIHRPSLLLIFYAYYFATFVPSVLTLTVMTLPATLFAPADAGRHWFSPTAVPSHRRSADTRVTASEGMILPSLTGRFPVSPDSIRPKRTKPGSAGGSPPGIGQSQFIHEKMGNDEMRMAPALAAVALRKRAGPDCH